MCVASVFSFHITVAVSPFVVLCRNRTDPELTYTWRIAMYSREGWEKVNTCNQENIFSCCNV